MSGRELSLDSTIFGAVHRNQFQNNKLDSSRGIWHNLHTIEYRKVDGPPLSRLPDGLDSASNESLSGLLAKDPRQAAVLQLLAALHCMFADHTSSSNHQEGVLPVSTLSASIFVNNKLTAKLNRQLEEPMIVASQCLPEWSAVLPSSFPFLFPFESRFLFLQSMSFGYARLMQKWLQPARAGSSSARRDENLTYLGRLQRQKVRIFRERLFESALKVFELYGSSKSMLEVEYFDEVGTVSARP